MSKFAVGDRVKVVSDISGVNRVGLAGVVVEAHRHRTSLVKLDTLRHPLPYDDDELELITPANPPLMKASVLYKDRVLKLHQADTDDTCRWVLIRGESDEALFVEMLDCLPSEIRRRDGPLLPYRLVYKATICEVEPTKFTAADVRG
jgi:hypothetical protein